MEDYNSVAIKIRTEIREDLVDVRKEFLEHFGEEADRFVDLMTLAFLRWSELDAAARQDQKKANVSGLVFSAITQHVISFRLFLSGFIVAAGNTQRQVLETIALALLCSCNQLDVLDRFMEDQYSTNNAVRDVLRQKDKLDVKEGALEVLRDSRNFYHMYSHPTFATLASHIRFSDQGRALYVGASFDDGKLEIYRKEVAERVSLAEVFENFVQGIIQNIASWKQP